MKKLTPHDNITFSFKVYALAYFMFMEMVGQHHGLNSKALLKEIGYEIACGHTMCEEAQTTTPREIFPNYDCTPTRTCELLTLAEIMNLPLETDLNFSLKVYCASYHSLMDEFAASHGLDPNKILRTTSREIAKEIK